MAEKTVIEITGAFSPETVENILELIMERMSTLRVVDFTVETRQTSDEELVEELEAEITEEGMSVESAEDTVQRMLDNDDEKIGWDLL